MAKRANKRAKSSVDAAEVERFSALAADWWSLRGPMAALHKLNPLRLAFIRDKVCERFDRDAKKLDCLKGLRILDIGCGAGILSEPLARLGAQMVGADPAEENIAAASAHAQESGLAIDYRATTAEDLAVQASASTWCWRWKWSSTSPTLPHSSPPVLAWSSQADC